jgi:hypothetical protein
MIAINPSLSEVRREAVVSGLYREPVVRSGLYREPVVNSLPTVRNEIILDSILL